jgi:hypothetical protein
VLLGRDMWYKQWCKLGDCFCVLRTILRNLYYQKIMILMLEILEIKIDVLDVRVNERMEIYFRP